MQPYTAASVAINSNLAFFVSLSGPFAARFFTSKSKSMYFDVTMQFTTITDDGQTKTKKAKFLIETETFGDSEQKAFGELGDNERDAVCCSIARSKVNEVVKVGDGESWFKVSYSTTITDDNGKEKTAKFLLLIDADNIGEATERADDHLKSHWQDHKIYKVEDGKYADVLEYETHSKTMKPKAVTPTMPELANIGKEFEIFGRVQNFIDNEKAINGNP